MAENLTVDKNLSKEEKYRQLIPQIKSLIKSENNTVANMANIAAAIKHTFDFLWVGFYIVQEGQLVLGPFQGPIACTRIHYGKGVCGTAWKEQKTLIVADVEKFPEHIACCSLSRSEIVLPIFVGNRVAAILDIDSEYLSQFDAIDEKYLFQITKMIIFQQ